MVDERAQIQEVFGLTGGELESEPWDLPCTDAYGKLQSFHCAYWYEGVPEWAGSDFPDVDGDTTHEYRTVVRDVTFGPPPEYTLDGWERVKVYSNSGEVECPYRQVNPGEEVQAAGTDPCPLCEEPLDQPHMYVYIGDGWAEVIYRRGITD